MSCALLLAGPPACINGSLASYIALGADGCTHKGITFANFSYSGTAGGGAQEIQAHQITVVLTLAVPWATGLVFQAPWSVGGAQLQDSIIKYTAVLPCGESRTAKADLTLGSAHIRGTSGSVTVHQVSNVGKLTVYTSCTEVCQTKRSETHQFNPVSVLLITDHVNVVGGNGGASLNEFFAELNLCVPCV